MLDSLADPFVVVVCVTIRWKDNLDRTKCTHSKKAKVGGSGYRYIHAEEREEKTNAGV